MFSFNFFVHMHAGLWLWPFWNNECLYLKHFKEIPFLRKAKNSVECCFVTWLMTKPPIFDLLQNLIRNFIFFFIPEDTLLTILVMSKFLFLLRNSDGICPDDSNYKFLYSRMTEVPNFTFGNKIYFLISDDWRRLSVSEQHSLRHWSGELFFQFQFIKENIFLQYLYIF
jgi:hypothetical protein